MFVLTDGEVANTKEILDLVRKHCSGSTTRVFSLGVGDSVSQHLVSGMARSGK